MSGSGASEQHGFDLGGMSDKLNWLAADLRQTGGRLRQAVDGAATRRYEAASPDGLVRITVDGRCRVASIQLSPYVSREDPDTLDRMLTTTLNEALDLARSGSREALLAALPVGMRAGIERLVDDPRAESGR
jgi:DNA-binding protein YbaB